MKYLALILSIYTLYLVSTPCADTISHSCSLATGQQPGQHQDTPSDHNDACSPFCICSCCNIPVTLEHYSLIVQPFFYFREIPIPESPVFLSLFCVSFWQPPKIG